jgi:hypothetical protein
MAACVIWDIPDSMTARPSNKAIEATRIFKSLWWAGSWKIALDDCNGL